MTLGNEVAVLEEHRVPVVHVAGVEAVEVVEPEAVGPAVERPGGARLPGGRVVVLADPGGHVAVLAQHLADGAATPRQDAGVAVVAGGRLGDDAGRGGVMVAAGDERGPRRAAKRRRVEAVVSQPLRRELIQGRRRDAAAEGRILAEPGVIEQDQHDVGRALGRLHRLRELRRVGVLVGLPDLALELEIRPRQHARRALVPWHAGNLCLADCTVGTVKRCESADQPADRYHRHAYRK